MSMDIGKERAIITDARQRILPSRQPKIAMTDQISNAPQIGEPLPQFSLPAAMATENGSESSTRCNADFLGKPWVLFVYPKDATSGCTVETQGFRDLHQSFRVLDCQIVGLSRDGIGAHKRFIEAQNLPFALLSDKEQNVLKSWDLIAAATMYGKPVTKVRRTTFLIDQSGIVRQIWNEVSPFGHAQEVLQAARLLSEK